MDKMLKLTSIFAVIAITISVVYYFLVFLPQKEQLLLDTQKQTQDIKKNCYAEAFRQNEDNFKWASGKIWTYLGAFSNDENGWVYPDYLQVRASINDAAKIMKTGAIFDETPLILDSLAKEKELRNAVYRQCLVGAGVSTSL